MARKPAQRRSGRRTGSEARIARRPPTTPTRWPAPGGQPTQRARRGPSTRPDADRTQCHFISNTHWDREWKYSAQRTRHMLVYMLDMLLDIFAREPKYKHFHLDSQTLPLLDYLEVRPEREADIRRHVRSGRLAVGPWFCLPDEFCISGESLIRNLLLGHRVAARFGAVSKTGYSPFSWGQISQMPQIYAGFGIDTIMFYRGVNTLVAPRAEFVWEGPDGTRILASRLGARPRYNVWYVLQRPAYWGLPLDGLNEFHTRWTAGHGYFRMVDEIGAELDYQLAHPPCAYTAEVVPAAAAQALREQDADWSTPHRMWSAGHDSSCPDSREVRMIADAAAALSSQAAVFHSTVAAFQAGVRSRRGADWPVVTGEMRHTYTKGSTSPLLGWIISARTYLKQDNFRTERLLTRLAEPLAVCAALLGAPYPRAFVDLAYQWLLQNHCHDSIGGCGRDVVHDDMLHRTRQAREIATCVLEQALMEIAGAVNLSGCAPEEVAVVVFNPAPFARTEVVPIVLDLPVEWSAPQFEIVDEAGQAVPWQLLGQPARFCETVHSPNDVFTYLEARRVQLRMECIAVPGLGYRTFRVRPAPRSRPRQPAGLLTGPQSMTNEFLEVQVNANGTLEVRDRQTGRRYTQLGYFRDSGEIGNPWLHVAPADDAVLTTLNATSRVTVVRDGELETTLRVEIDWALPESAGPDGQSRSPHLRPYPIVNTVTLRRGTPWVEVVTELDNVVADHYLRVSFPTGLAAEHVQVQTPFDVVDRPIATPDFSRFDDVPQSEQPMDSFVDISAGEHGLALLNEGLKAYEAHDDAERTVSLTLLRCFALKFFVPEKCDHPDQARGAQCPGPHSFRYAIMPHAGDWVRGEVWAAAERFTVPLVAGQIAPTRHGTQPAVRSFLEVEPAGLHVAAVKQSEDGAGWVVRLFNPWTETVRGRLRLNGGRNAPPGPTRPIDRLQAEFALPADPGPRWRTVRLVSLEEQPQSALRMDAAGWVRLTIPRKKIMTIEFRP